MQELILLRHAEALAAAAGGDDHSRALSPRGEQEALAAGRWLASHGARPDRVLCSPAARARRTAELAMRALAPEAPIGLCEEVYEATPGALLDQHADARCVLLVGHNPGIERLVALLVEGRSDEFRGMPPAGLAVLHLQAGLEPGNARLDAFWSP
jgi:phosphohistidine phosphatase SixA